MEENSLSENVPVASTSKTNRLGMCEVCNGNGAKYTCPSCEVKTCCLKCSAIHKDELRCDGKRNKAKFIPINKFSNLDLSSDVQFLEEITRSVNTLKKNNSFKYLSYGKHLPNNLFKLKKAALLRRTYLKFLPPDFARHKRNTTLHNYSSNTVHWRLDWIFVNADNLILVDENVGELNKISTLFHKYLIKQEDKVVQEKLQYYQSADLPGIRLFVKAEEKPGNCYYELDPLLTVKDNLKNMVIIEYPTIYVVLKDHASGYNVIDTDDEYKDMDSESATGKEVVERIIKNAEKEENLYSSLKNLLFISEYSDAENEM